MSSGPNCVNTAHEVTYNHDSAIRDWYLFGHLFGFWLFRWCKVILLSGHAASAGLHPPCGMVPETGRAKVLRQRVARPPAGLPGVPLQRPPAVGSTQSYRGPLRIGLPIGSLTSQHFANFYLGWLDRFVTESLRVRGYVRYMEDMVLWHASRETLVEVHARREEFAATHLALDFKPGEVRRTGGGVPFLGCRIFPTRGSFQDSFQCVYTGASTIRLLNAARIGRRVCNLRCGIADAGRREKHTLSCNLCGFGQPGVLNRTVPHDLLCSRRLSRFVCVLNSLVGRIEVHETNRSPVVIQK
jgi:hypothetical protein